MSTAVNVLATGASAGFLPSVQARHPAVSRAARSPGTLSAEGRWAAPPDLSSSKPYELLHGRRMIEYEAMGLTPRAGARAILEGWTQRTQAAGQSSGGVLKAKGHPSLHRRLHACDTLMQLTGPVAEGMQLRWGYPSSVASSTGRCGAVCNYVSRCLEPVKCVELRKNSDLVPETGTQPRCPITGAPAAETRRLTDRVYGSREFRRTTIWISNVTYAERATRADDNPMRPIACTIRRRAPCSTAAQYRAVEIGRTLHLELVSSPSGLLVGDGTTIRPDGAESDGRVPGAIPPCPAGSAVGQPADCN